MGLVSGTEVFAQRQLDLFRSSPALFLSVKRRFELRSGDSSGTSRFFVDSESYGGRVASAGLTTGADLLVVHEVTPSALDRNHFLISRAWVLVAAPNWRTSRGLLIQRLTSTAS